MFMPKIELVVFVSVLLGAFATLAAAANCTKNVNFSEWKSCCNVPDLNFESYNEQCEQYKRRPGQTSPCHIQCVFNASNTITNDQLDIESGREMFTTLLDGNQDFIDVFTDSFDKCRAVANQRYAQIKNKQGNQPRRFSGPNGEKCSPLATFYAMCANQKVFINCPESAWTTSTVCDNAKRQAAACESNNMQRTATRNDRRNGPRRG